MRRSALTLGFLALAAATAVGACSSGGGSSAGGTGGRGASATGGSGGGSTGTGGAGGQMGAGGAGGTGSPYTKVAVCGQRGRATANATAYDGYEELFMTGEEGLGTDVCVVRFDVKRVAAAPAGCTVCRWTHMLEYSNPMMLTDVDGACAKSDLGLDAAAIGRLVGSRLGIGFAQMLDGAHGSARMKYFDGTAAWDVYGNATWDETMNLFRYDHRDGFCNY